MIQGAKQILVHKNKVTKRMRNKFGLYTNKQNVITRINKLAKTKIQKSASLFCLKQICTRGTKQIFSYFLSYIQIRYWLKYNFERLFWSLNRYYRSSQRIVQFIQSKTHKVAALER